MKFWRFLGWLFIPYIMIFIRWYDIGKTARILFTSWAVILLMSAYTNRPQLNQPTRATSTQTKQSDQTKQSNPPKSESPKTIHSSTPTTIQPVLTPKQKLQKEINQYNIEKSLGKATQQELEQLLKDEVEIDKSSALKSLPTTEDIGYVGDLMVQTTKNTLQEGKGILNSLVPTQADGMYWVFPITIDDIGSDPISIDPSMFQIETKDGSTYNNDLNAEISIQSDTPSVTFESINPMIDTKRLLIFDMPMNVNPSDISLKINYGFKSTLLHMPTLLPSK